MALSMESQYGQNLRVGRSSSPSGWPTLTTCRNCRLGRHLSRARNLVVRELSWNTNIFQLREREMAAGWTYLERNQGSELDVKVSGEPVGRPQSVQNVPGGRRAQSVLLDIISEMFLEPQQSVHVPVVVNLPRPVVAEHDVGRMVLQLLQSEDLQVPDVIGRPATVVVIRRLLEVT